MKEGTRSKVSLYALYSGCGELVCDAHYIIQCQASAIRSANGLWELHRGCSCLEPIWILFSALGICKATKRTRMLYKRQMPKNLFLLGNQAIDEMILNQLVARSMCQLVDVTRAFKPTFLSKISFWKIKAVVYTRNSSAPCLKTIEFSLPAVNLLLTYA